MSTDFKELKRKADSGDVISQMDLALSYLQGDVNGYSELSEGIKYMEMAASSGIPKIQCICADAYNSAGMYQPAFSWYQKAAEQGDAQSQAMLAKYYFAGAGTEKNDAKAFNLAKMAYQNGDRSESCVVMGILYLQGKVVSSDGLQAYKMFKLASQSGNEEATEFKLKMEAEFPELKRYN